MLIFKMVLFALISTLTLQEMYKICPHRGGGAGVRPKLEELCNLISHKLYLFSKVGT